MNRINGITGEKWNGEPDTPGKLLEDLLAIHSVNSQDRELDVAEYLADYFQSHGLAAAVQPIDEKRGNVVAFAEGKDPTRTMVWSGHLDTVPYGSPEEWETDPSLPVVKDGKLYGRGASDMKSGLAAMVYALCHLEEKPFCNIRFLGTCDEEKNGLGAAEVIRRAEDSRVTETPLWSGCRDADWILVGEPTGMRLGTAQKGCLWLEMNVRGRTSHGAYPQKGANAVEAGMRMAGEIGDFVRKYTHPLLGGSTAQVTRIEGGVANNMTPDRCRIVMDIRLVPGVTAQEVLEKAGEVLNREQEASESEENRIDADFVFLNHRRAIEIDKDHPMPALLREKLQEQGYDGEEIGINFFTDASVLDRSGEKDILLFGPGDPSLAHQPNEYVELERYEDAVRILKAFCER